MLCILSFYCRRGEFAPSGKSDFLTEGANSPLPAATKEIDAEEAAKKEQAQTCVKIFGVAVVAVFFVVLLSAIFGDKDDVRDLLAFVIYRSGLSIKVANTPYINK